MSIPIKFINTIYGQDGQHWSPYLTRVSFGRLKLHIFHRGDADAECHDHPWDFWTFPLTGYIEEVLDTESGEKHENYVTPFRLHKRPAKYAHRVIVRARPWLPKHGLYIRVYGRKIVTIVFMSKSKTSWGFWKTDGGKPCRIPWKKYVYEGGKNAPCETEGLS